MSNTKLSKDDISYTLPSHWDIMMQQKFSTVELRLNSRKKNLVVYIESIMQTVIKFFKLVYNDISNISHQMHDNVKYKNIKYTHIHCIL